MTNSKYSLIGHAMNWYRRSPFHNAHVGAILAKILGFATRFRKPVYTVREVDGVIFDLDVREVIDSSLYYSGTFEPQIERIIERFLQPGMIAIDIGANIGYHTLRMARLVKPEGFVYAIEPTSWAHAKLIRNCSLNPTIDNIRIIKVGLTSKDCGEQVVSFRSSYRLNGVVENCAEVVRLLTLDTLASELSIDKVNFIKLDVDGFEGLVLTGTKNTLKRFLPAIVVEITPSEMEQSGTRAQDLISFLEELGYSFLDEHQKEIYDLSDYCARLAIGCSAMVVAVNLHNGRRSRN